MNKDFWERIDRLEELTKKTTRSDWDIHVKGDNAYATNVDFHQVDNLRYIAAANPAMILEMVEEIKDLQSEILAYQAGCNTVGCLREKDIRRLEREADWLAEKLEMNVPLLHEDAGWREAARKAVANE